MNMHHVLIACVLMALGAGCSAGAQVVRTGGGGGELTMWGPMMPAAQHGREALLEHCGGAYRVDSQGEALGLGRAHATLADAQPLAASGDDNRVVRFRCEANGTLASR
jgi:hypothetical protein